MPKPVVNVYFSDFFDVPPETLQKYGTVNISLLNDFPLFIDPFLLFNSPKPEYKLCHSELLNYLRFLRGKAATGTLTSGLLAEWLTFPEVKQTWLGFSLKGNQGRGLGLTFAKALAGNLATVFATFGDEQVTKSSHLEKLCLLDDGIGRDKISDLTTNLIKRLLLEYSQTFARTHLPSELRKVVGVRKVSFNYDTESWVTGQFELPWHPFLNDYVVLTPRDILTKIDIWINKPDLFDQFHDIVVALPNTALRDQVNNYFRQHLPKKPKREDEERAIARTLRQFPLLLEWYIKLKEDEGDEASKKSASLVAETENQMVRRLGEFILGLAAKTAFYNTGGTTLGEARARIAFLKDVIEHKGGHRIFWNGNTPIRRESDAQIMFRLTWYATPSDLTREANDGRGPVDFKVSRGAFDKSLVEFKLASNKHLAKNLAKQVDVYKKASDAPHGLVVILYFTGAELQSVRRTLKALGLDKSTDIILIDARADNKPSGSKAA